MCEHTHDGWGWCFAPLTKRRRGQGEMDRGEERRGWRGARRRLRSQENCSVWCHCFKGSVKEGRLAEVEEGVGQRFHLKSLPAHQSDLQALEDQQTTLTDPGCSFSQIRHNWHGLIRCSAKIKIQVESQFIHIFLLVLFSYSSLGKKDRKLLTGDTTRRKSCQKRRPHARHDGDNLPSAASRQPQLRQREAQRTVNSMEQIKAKTIGHVPEKTTDKEASNRYTEGLFNIHRESTNNYQPTVTLLLIAWLKTPQHVPQNWWHVQRTKAKYIYVDPDRCCKLLNLEFL